MAKDGEMTHEYMGFLVIGVPPFFVSSALRDLVVGLGFDLCLEELKP
jgi:hypothetical protein